MLFSQSSFSFQFYWKKFLQKLTPESCTSISRFLSFSQSFKSNKYKQKQLHSKFPSSLFSMQDLLCTSESPEPLWKLACSFSLQLCPQTHIETSCYFLLFFFYSRKIICKLSPSPLKTWYVSCYFLKKIQWASKLCAEVFCFPP